MVTAGGALRTKVFTATWPSFATDTRAYADGTRGSRRGAGNQHNSPRCQVEIRTLSADSTEDALISGGTSSGWLEGGGFPGDDGVDGDGGDDNVVFLDPSLLLRRYNSVSLAEDGTYRLTLSDCYGFVAAPSMTSAIGGEHAAIGGELASGEQEYGVETARLLFLSLPLSLDFEINGQVSSGGGLEIGGFQLVPVVYMPPPPPPPPPLQQLVVPSSLKLERAHVTDDSEIFTTPAPLSSSPSSAISTGTLRSSAGEYGGGRARFSGLLVSGTVVGVVAVVSMAWLMVARGWGRGTWEKLMNGADGRDGGRKQEGRPLDTGAGGAGGADGGDEGGGSDAGSSDSDTILRGHLPDPVGLPRSDEDWRTLFDTLYEDEKD